MTGHRQCVADRADRIERDAYPHVTEGEVEVHQADPVAFDQGDGRSQIDRDGGLAAAALCGEHGNHLALRGFRLVREPQLVPRPVRQRPRPLASRVERYCVAGADHLPHTGAEGFGEQCDVYLLADENHAGGRSLHPQLCGELQRFARVCLRTDHDQVLGRGVEQGADRGVEVVDRADVPAEVRDQIIRRTGRLAHDGHRSPHFFFVAGGNWGTTWLSGVTCADGPSSARYGRPVWVSRIRRSASSWLTARVTSVRSFCADDPCENALFVVLPSSCVGDGAGPIAITRTLGTTTRVLPMPLPSCCLC